MRWPAAVVLISCLRAKGRRAAGGVLERSCSGPGTAPRAERPGASRSNHWPQHGDDVLGDLLSAVTSVEGTEVAAEAHGGDGVLVDVVGQGPVSLQLRQNVFDQR